MRCLSMMLGDRNPERACFNVSNLGRPQGEDKRLKGVVFNESLTIWEVKKRKMCSEGVGGLMSLPKVAILQMVEDV